jgi:hypothetical protein
MQYVKITAGKVDKYPYALSSLYLAYPNTSFPSVPDEGILNGYGVFSVTFVPPPAHDAIRQDLVEGPPTLVSGKWTQTWEVKPAAPETVAQRLEQQRRATEQQRLQAYREEADPLFFMAQRGEATMAEWQAKVAEIKARFPYAA